MPRVTVLCPTYNRGPAIQATIASVARQTMTDWEMIVASDASDDDTDDVVARLAEREPRLRLLRTRRFGFPSAPCNLASRHARSDVIACIGHDDQWEPNHLAVLTDAIDAGASLAYTRAHKVDATGTVLSITPLLTQYWHPETQLMSALFEPARAAYRASVVHEVGGWRESPIGLEDWDLWVRLVDAGIRFTPLAVITARLLYDAGTRQHSLPVEHSVEIARFPDARSARAAYRALTDRRMTERFASAYRRDVLHWYRRLSASGELMAPAEWRGSSTRLIAAIEQSLTRDIDMWQTMTIQPRAGQFVLANAVATQTAEHADRIALMYQRVMGELCALVDEALQRSGVAVCEAPAAS